ncbi:MAG: PQQ-binding-like beta-propeller repeat protein, partial [Candidatus Omnitrophica bacterium]|nr:PQQ-binding-like beta-propeller repeat protein [Candidatus Omnitrophota bacterium]
MKKIAALILLLLAVIIVPVSAGEEWTKTLGEEITAVATDEYGDRIFVGTESGMLYCYDSGGSVVWSRSLASAITTLEVSQAGDIVRAYMDGTGAVYSLNGATGTNLGSHGRTTPYGYSISMPRDGSLSIEGGTSGAASG